MHSRLISNNILGRIYYRSGHDDSEKLRINSAARFAFIDWIAANHEHAPPKALADLFEANAWLIVQVYQFPALCNHLKALLFPLLPTALSMYEATPSGTQRQYPSDHFVSQIRHWRKRDARKVEQEHVEFLIPELANITSNRPFCAAVEHLRLALEQGPSVRFDNDGNIEGTHQHLQLLGYNLLRYYIAADIDRSLPLNRSVVKGAAKFQSVSQRYSTYPHSSTDRLNRSLLTLRPRTNAWNISSGPLGWTPQAILVGHSFPGLQRRYLLQRSQWYMKQIKVRELPSCYPRRCGVSQASW